MNRIILLVNLLIIGYIGFRFARLSQNSELMPVYQDEFTYYNSGRMFSENNSVEATTILDNKKSEIGKTHWYGPMFHLYYGSIFKIFGSGWRVFIMSNLVLFVLNILVVLKLPHDFKQGSKLLFVFLCTYASTSFIFTWFPESLILLFAWILLYFYTRIDGNRFGTIIFVLLILLFSTFRVTFIFWSLILVLKPGPWNKRYKYAALSVCIIFLGVLYLKYFTAPAVASGLSAVTGVKTGHSLFDRITEVLGNIGSNLKLLYNYLYFQPFGFMKLFAIFIVVLVTLPWGTLLNRSKVEIIHVETLLLALISFFIFFSLYTVAMIYLEKQLVFVIPLLCYFIYENNKSKIELYIYMIFLVLPWSLAAVNKNIEMRQESAKSMKSEKVKINDFISCINKLPVTEGENVVAFNLNEFHFENDIILYYLPIKVKNKKIVYINSLIDSTSFIYDHLRKEKIEEYQFVISTKKSERNGLKYLYDCNGNFVYSKYLIGQTE